MSAKQLSFFKKHSSAYGGDLLKTRKGRRQGRPLSTKNSMHLVLRSSKAVGPWSFLRPQNRQAVQRILQKFSKKYAVQMRSYANVGNHLHLQIRLSRRSSYPKFIKAITAAIAISVTGVHRWTQNPGEKLKFWDRRPFTRIVEGFRAVLTLKNYIALNELEGMGMPRLEKRSRPDKYAYWKPPS